MSFRLAHDALDDLEAICFNEAERSGWDHSMDIEAQLWEAFATLGKNPGIGHRRSDITSAALYFFFSNPYMIVYRSDLTPIAITSIIHGSRDLEAMLAERPTSHI
jgi:plasmid stabilization system protein ParE